MDRTYRSTRSMAGLMALLMLAVSLLFLISPADNAEAAAPTGWYAQNAGQAGLSFREVSAVSSNIAWAVATEGWVARTLDGGTTWERRRGLPGG